MTRMLPHPQNERQQSVNNFRHCIMDLQEGGAATLTHNGTIGRRSMQKWFRQQCYVVLKMSINSVSLTFVPASWKIQRLCSDINPLSNYQLPF